MEEITLKRDGLTLKGTLERPTGSGKCPITIIFHGLMSSRGVGKGGMHDILTQKLLKRGIAVIRFDFNGHGESGGEFEDMTVYGEILDAMAIMEYVRQLDWVSEIYIAGHSQGALVGGMTAGYYRELVKKLVLMAPAATIPDDAQRGSCFGKIYDTYNPPEYIDMKDVEQNDYRLGQKYMRLARTIPVYETTSMFLGKTLIIHGTKDEAVGLIGSLRYKKCMDNVTLHIIEGETHGLDTISLDSVLEEAADFLKN